MRFSFDALKALTGSFCASSTGTVGATVSGLIRVDGRCSEAAHAGPPNIHVGSGFQEELDHRQLIFRSCKEERGNPATAELLKRFELAFGRTGTCKQGSPFSQEEVVLALILHKDPHGLSSVANPCSLSLV